MSDEPQERLQLSQHVTTGRYAGCTVEDVINVNPEYVQQRYEHGTLGLSAGAFRYLQEQLKERREQEMMWNDAYQIRPRAQFDTGVEDDDA